MPNRLFLVLFLITCAVSAFGDPRVESVTPGSGPVGTQVQISGTGFGATQGTSTIRLNNVAATVVGWSDTLITATVPNTASGAIAVTVSGVSSNTNLFFSVTSPTVTAVVPNAGPLGAQVQINGRGFGATKGTSSVWFYSSGASIISWSDTQIVATVPSGSLPITMPVKVAVNGVGSNTDVVYTSTNPMISAISPGEGAPDTQVDLLGSGFGQSQGSSTVNFHMGTASIVSWSDTHIVATVPPTAISGTVTVKVGGVTSNTNMYFNVPPPHITSVTPTIGQAGTQFTVSGSGFHPAKGSSSVQINNVAATVISWSDTQIVANAPLTASGFVKVVVNGVGSNTDIYFSMPNPHIDGLDPSFGPVGTVVQVRGSGFGDTQGSSTVSFHGVGVMVPGDIVSWSDTLIVARVPSSVISGIVQVKVAGILSNNVNFTVPAPVVSSVTPTSGVVGDQITISGSGFQDTQRPTYTFAYVNGTSAPIVSWSDTQIVATVPTTKSGPIKVMVNDINSNQNVWFSMPNPVIDNISPTAGPAGTVIQIDGSGFGESQGSSSISFSYGFYTQIPTVTSWSDSQIIITQPSGVNNGSYLRVTVGGVVSNYVIYYGTSPAVDSLSPSSGPAGTQVTVGGIGFGSTQGTSTISFNNTTASVSSWSDTQIVATVPAGATTGAVKVVKGTSTSNTNNTFTVTGVLVRDLSPASGPSGTQVQVNGSGFGATQGTNTIKFNNVAASVVTWSETQIVATVPITATTGAVKVTVGTTSSNTDVIFTVPAPHIDSITPAQGVMGTQITLAGSGFQPTRGSSYVQINWINAKVVSWSDTQVVVLAQAQGCCDPPMATGPVSSRFRVWRRRPIRLL